MLFISGLCPCTGLGSRSHFPFGWHNDHQESTVTKLEITVPDIGLESEEIKFGSWLKAIGDTVEAGEDLFEIEADKATVVCEAMAGGTLAEITVTGGDVHTGDVIGYLNAG